MSNLKALPVMKQLVMASNENAFLPISREVKW